MTTLVFDTLQLTAHLKAAGLAPEQAEAVVRAIATAQDGLVTKSDLDTALAPLRTDLTVLKWMMAFLLAIAASMVVKVFLP
jgi:hypothetical protein